jgi:hypothetical protein
MNELSLIPTDLVTHRMLVEVLTAMVKHHIATKKVPATSEFLRPNVAMADTLPAQTETQPDSTAVTGSRQSRSKCGGDGDDQAKGPVDSTVLPVRLRRRVEWVQRRRRQRVIPMNQLQGQLADSQHPQERLRVDTQAAQ